MKAIITGGGTGGHIYPAISVGLKLKERGWDIIYVGSKEGLENKIVPKNNIKLKNVEVAPLPRRISLNLIKAFYKSTKGYFQTKKIVEEVDPDIIFGTGGFVAGPVVLSACREGIPGLIHEQNVYPGITNKLLAYSVDKVALNYEEAVKYFSDRITNKFVVTGNPIREKILQTKRKEGINNLKLKNSKNLSILNLRLSLKKPLN